jgi:flagellar basal body-associated protein FliL
MRPRYLSELEKRRERVTFVKVLVAICLVMYGIMGLMYWGIHR